MSKTKILTSVCVCLLISNAALLLFLFLGKSHRPNQERNRNIIIEKLHLDKNQIVRYDSLIKIHRTEIGSAQEKIATLKNSLYSQLNLPKENQKADSIIQEINSMQKNIEYTHYRHFEGIKNICTSEQKPSYEALTKELVQMFRLPLMPPKKK